MRQILCVCMMLAMTTTAALTADAGTEWDLTEMYETPAAAVAARSAVAARIGELEACRGHLGDSAADLLRCLELRSALEKELYTVLIYAARFQDLDLRNALGQKLKAETDAVGVRLSEATAWMRPEILSLGSETIGRFLAEEDGLAPYARPLREMLRLEEHTLPPEQEALLARVGMISGKFSDIYDQLTISDLPFPTVELPGIGEVKLNQAGYVRFRGHPDREVRETVFREFWKAYEGYENTLGTVLNAEIQKSWMYADARGYSSAVEAALYPSEVPVEVYESLIANVRANLQVLHRALRLRQRMLGLETQGYPDIYASIIPDVEMEFPWQETGPILGEAMAPLGDRYVEQMTAGLGGWVDVYPRDGKQTGAYSSGWWYDGHPWVLMNYDSSYDSLSTLAHEFGHAMHSWLSNRNQPFPTARYSGVVAEVASTFNENLLMHQMLGRTTDRQERLFLLGTFLEQVRQTVFRQTMFAEFQLEIHRRAEAGESLTGESLSELYLRLLREYHGHDEGVMRIDDQYRVEWSYIPHFYMGFYVYQYATGLVASTALAEQVRAGEPGAVERYLAMLSSGSADGPIELLRAAGADLTTPGPFELTMRAAERAMDEIERLLASEG